MQPDETRAEIARRRLAQLVETFDARLPPDGATKDAEPEPAHEPAARSHEPEGGVPAGHRVARRVPRRIGPVHVRAVAAVIAVVALLVGWQVVSGRPSAAPAGGSPGLAIDAGPSSASDGASDGAADDGADTAAGEELVIDVVGHVHRPGIVILPPGSRVHEAIEAAGGLTGPVDTTALNMARKLTDGEQILVGITPVVPAGGGTHPDGSGAPAGGLVNLNTATEAELDDLPGVGPVTAASILEWRQENGQFSSVDDLLEVRGIGEATLEDLRDHVTV